MANPPGRDKAILTCALNGDLVDPRHVPVPIGFDDLATAARRAVDAGASIIHLHVRDPRPGHRHQEVQDEADVERLIRRVRTASPGVIISLAVQGTTTAHLAAAVRANPEMVLVDASQWAELYPSCSQTDSALFNDDQHRDGVVDPLMASETSWLEIECRTLGDLSAVARLYASESFRDDRARRSLIHLVVGKGSTTLAEPGRVDFMVEHLPERVAWMLSGRGRSDVWPLQRRAIELGGMLRTGFEDTAFRRDGTRARDNAELVADLVALACEVGRDVASPAEARAMLGMAA